MEAKEYLSRYHNLQLKIQKKHEYIDFCEERSRLVSSPVYGEREGTSPNRNLKAPFEKWILRKIDAERELKELEKEVVIVKAETEEAIAKLHDVELERIIAYRYLDWLLWAEIGDIMAYSKSTLKRKHNAAMEILDATLTL